jgi:DNA polymerase-3 subunit gamma/tau
MAKRKPADTGDETPVESQGYTVLARRYRPQLFGELVGQEPVAQALANAISSDRVAHAYLFTGARGVGKTSTARILARALNCEQGPTVTPCGTCDSCRRIAAGEDVDVLEIDGASNRGIDEVREIRQNVQFRPQHSRYKIYIIDEVHMLTAPAFNALLKTLEEPPPQVKFIFATTEVHKIPVTILSRCQRFDFSGISTPRIVERLRSIVQSEKMEADDDALELVARRAGGSMRDAQSLLDQLLAFSKDKLSVGRVHQLLGTAGEERVAALAAAVIGRDGKQALEQLGQAADQGLQLGELLDQLIEYWRDLMVFNCAAGAAPPLSVTGAQRDALRQQAQQLSLDSILAGLDVLVSAKNRLRMSQHSRVLVEMALVRLSRLDDLVPLGQLAQWLAQGGTPRPAVAPAPRPAALTAPPEGAKKKPLNGASSAAPAAAAVLSLTQEALSAVWGELLTRIGPLLAAELRNKAQPAISGPNTLVIRFPARYNHESARCQEPANASKLEKALCDITGQPCKLRFEAVTEVATTGATTAPAVAETETAQARSRRQKNRAEQVPLLKSAIDVLGAQVVQMDDDFDAAPPAGTDPQRADATAPEEP